MNNRFYKSLILAVLAVLGVENVRGQALFTNDGITISNPSGMTITVEGAFTNKNSGLLTNKGTVEVTGDWSNTGNNDLDSGLVRFNGASAQNITGKNKFYDLLIDNTTGVTLSSGIQKILHELTISNGTFDVSADSMILYSDSVSTARIAEITGTGDITGDITMERYVDTGLTGWHFVSAAVSGATVSDWDQEMVLSIPDGLNGTACCPTFYSVQSYDESVSGTSDNGFTDVTTVATSIVAGKGYWVYTGTKLGVTDPFTFDVTGPTNKFSVSLLASWTNNSLPDDDGWIMAGNPYPSTIDWDAAGWTKSNMDDAIYVWDPDSGRYASYISSVGTNGGSQYISSSQAFWVKANATSPTLTVTEPVKTAMEPGYFKMSTVPNVFRMRVDGQGLGDEMVIRFLPAATAGFDHDYDAYKLSYSGSPAPNISSVISGLKDLSINAMPELVTDMQIPVKVTVSTTGTYTIKAGHFNDMPTSSCILLEDNFTGVFTNLRTTNSYTCIISNTIQIPRFTLHIGAPVSSEGLGLVCKGDNSGMAVAKGSGGGPWDYIWEDTLGNVLQSNSNVLGSDTLNGLTKGSYVFTVIDANGYCATRMDTVSVGEPGTDLAANGYVTNISCDGESDGIAGVNGAGGIPPYHYNWSTGDTTDIIENLGIGNYVVEVTDANGCPRFDTVTISMPDAISMQYVKTNVACFGDNSGSINLSVLGGTAPYGYSWSNGDSIEDITALTSGLYSVNITDANGCSSPPLEITIDDGLQVASGYTAPPISYLTNNAEVQFTSISLNATSYLWDFADGNTSVEENPLHTYSASGTYSVVLTAYNGTCEDSHSDVITILESTTGLSTTAPIDQVTFTKDLGDIIVKFNLNAQTQVTIEVINAAGQVILSTPANVGQTDVKLGLVDLSLGTYLVRVTADDLKISRKFVLGE